MPVKLPFNLSSEKLAKFLSEIASKGSNLIYLIGSIVIAVFLMSFVLINFSLDQQKTFWQKELDNKSVLLDDIRSVKDRRALLDQIMKEETKVRETLGELTATLPGDVVLSALAYENADKQIFLQANAPDIIKVGQTIKNIESSPHFSETTLVEARKSDATMSNNTAGAAALPPMSFKVSFKVDD